MITYQNHVKGVTPSPGASDICERKTFPVYVWCYCSKIKTYFNFNGILFCEIIQTPK